MPRGSAASADPEQDYLYPKERPSSPKMLHVRPLSPLVRSSWHYRTLPLPPVLPPAAVFGFSLARIILDCRLWT